MIATLFLLFSGQQCQRELKLEYVLQKWIHLHENDQDDVLEYRPDDYDFPLARGRDGMEFKEDGTFVQYDIAPTDGNVAVNGTWEPAGDQGNVLLIQFPDKPKKNYRIEIVELSEDVLKIKKLPVVEK